MGAKRHVRRAPAGGRANRDRGAGRSSYNLAGDVPWPTMGDGTAWTAAVKRVAHVYLEDSAGTIHPPELVEGAWTAVVEWDATEKDGPVQARCPLDNLLPA